MATTPEGQQLTSQHRVLQQRLAALTATEMNRLWQLLDVDNLEATSDRWLAAALTVVESRRTASAALADRYYTQFRLIEVGTRVDTVPLRPMNRAQVTTSLLTTGPFRVAAGGRPGSTEAAVRHVLSGGRDSIVGTVAADQTALGWIRVTSINPCAFCALLASRGPVYKSNRSAGFQAHDACRCMAEPVYDRNTSWPGRSREWATLYTESAQGQSDPLNAFRRAYEAA